MFRVCRRGARLRRCPVSSQPQTGSWWGLVSVLKHSEAEFDAYRSMVPMACPDDGEPLQNAPATDAGSGVERFCKYCGWSYPRDWSPPSRPGAR